MLHLVAHISTGVSEERIASIIRVNGISELRKMLAVTSKLCLKKKRVPCAIRPIIRLKLEGEKRTNEVSRFVEHVARKVTKISLGVMYSILERLSELQGSSRKHRTLLWCI
jgi:hypothetical protein